jgi:FAD dependent oxidoreductase TIGR03364
MKTGFDLAVVGAGIVGLAHALAAARRGLRVVVIDRDAQANGASVRNFGFITVTGQQTGDCWRRAMRSRDVWAQIAPEAGIEVIHQGLGVAVTRPESIAVLEAFRRTEMGEHCELLTPEQAHRRMPALRSDALQAVLFSPHELRVESRDAIPRLAAWLEKAHGVHFMRRTLVTGISLPSIETTAGTLQAQAAVVCPGDDYLSLYPERIAAYGLTRCALQMLRVRPASPVKMGAALMSDPSLVRYLGWSELPESQALRARLEQETPELLVHGIHLIAVQSGDGSLVVGDSHVYAPTPGPFGLQAVDDLILRELDAVADLPGRTVSERWMGIYASAPDRLMLVDRPAERVRLVIVTSGTGASTAFGIAEEVIDELL